MRSLLALAAALPGALLASAGQDKTFAPVQLFELQGRAKGDCFGVALVGGTDFDGDGTPDLLVGAKNEIEHMGALPTHVAESPAKGYVVLVSGRTRAPLFEVDSESTGDGFGSELVVVGDVNGDGIPDIAAGAPLLEGLLLEIIGVPLPGSRQRNGRVVVLSGSSGEQVLRIEGVPNFGDVLASLGDVNGDQVPDIAVGVSLVGKDKPGRVEVRSGKDGALVWNADGEYVDGQFGDALAVLADVDDDGIADLLVGDSTGRTKLHHQGTLTLLSGASGKKIRDWSGDTEFTYFGDSVAAVGDLNADGLEDFVVGATGSRHAGEHSGSAFLLDGKSDKPRLRLDGLQGRSFGTACAGVGDINGDGVPDYGVAANLDRESADKDGYVRVFSGVDASLLCQVPGLNLAGCGDLNADGRADFATASYRGSHSSAEIEGTMGIVRVWTLGQGKQ